MADQPTTITIPIQTYLEDMDRRHTRALEDIHSDVSALKADVKALQIDRARRTGVTDGLAKTWAAAILAVGVVVNIPAAWFYISGGH